MKLQHLDRVVPVTQPNGKTLFYNPLLRSIINTGAKRDFGPRCQLTVPLQQTATATT